MAHSNAKSHQRPQIQFTSGLREGEWVILESDSAIIGRDESADIQLDSPIVSRQHLDILKTGGYWFIRDLYSKNGVILNRARVHPGELTPIFDRDRIQIGSVVTFIFSDPEATIHESQLTLCSSGLWLDEPNRAVIIREQRLSPPLSQQQFTLLSLLFHQHGKVVTNEAIAQVLWPDAVGGIESAAIDNAISRLRERLAELEPDHVYIETVRGVGRRFVQHSEIDSCS